MKTLYLPVIQLGLRKSLKAYLVVTTIEKIEVGSKEAPTYLIFKIHRYITNLYICTLVVVLLVVVAARVICFKP